MEIYYNELSNEPLAATEDGARQKFVTLLETLKVLRGKEFTFMRTNEGFYSQPLAPDYSYSSIFKDESISRTLKTLLQSIVAHPYIPNIDSAEAEQYITTTFSTKNHLGDDVVPDGLASAHLFCSPSISLSGSEHWEKETLILTIIDGEDANQVNILNVYSVESISNATFDAWLNPPQEEIQLNTEKNIYEVFPPEVYTFDAQAISDILSWYYDDKRFIVRIKDLLNDIPQNPFKGGIGKTERLIGSPGLASKRIIKKDRIKYTYEKGKIQVHECRTHYGDT